MYLNVIYRCISPMWSVSQVAYPRIINWEEKKDFFTLLSFVPHFSLHCSLWYNCISLFFNEINIEIAKWNGNVLHVLCDCFYAMSTSLAWSVLSTELCYKLFCRAATGNHQYAASRRSAIVDQFLLAVPCYPFLFFFQCVTRMWEKAYHKSWRK